MYIHTVAIFRSSHPFVSCVLHHSAATLKNVRSAALLQSTQPYRSPMPRISKPYKLHGTTEPTTAWKTLRSDWASFLRLCS